MNERALARAAILERGRKLTRAVAAAWLLLAIANFVLALISPTGLPLLSLALLAFTAGTALALAAGYVWARWGAVFFTSAYGLGLLQRVGQLGQVRAQVIAIAVLLLAISAVLLFDRSVAAYCRERSTRR